MLQNPAGSLIECGCDVRWRVPCTAARPAIGDNALISRSRGAIFRRSCFTRVPSWCAQSPCFSTTALSTDRRPNADFVGPVPIRKTRAGLQFTCAAPAPNQRDVWVCNSDGYVGQVCVLSLYPEPAVTSCNGVCNARILCVTSIPAPQHGEWVERATSTVERGEGSGASDPGSGIFTSV